MKRVIAVLVTFIMCSVLCSCGNKTDIESSKQDSDKNDNKSRIELTTENWNDYFTYEFKVDATVNTNNVYDDILPVYNYCNVDMKLASKSERLTFEDVKITFKVNTLYADLMDNLNYSTAPNQGLKFTKGTQEITVDVDLFGNGNKKIEIYDFLCYIPQLPIESFSIESISGYANLD